MSVAKYGMSAINCTEYPLLEANSDISGIGVVAAFIASAYLTVICCIAKAVIDYKRVFTIGPNNSSLNRWSHALEIVVIGLSDQQIITGLSIIVGGLTQLGYGLESYHFESIVNLAWFSTITHLITLTILRDEVRSKKPARFYRLFGMALLAIMLICVSLPSGYSNAGHPPSYSLPAWCLYHPSLNWSRIYPSSRPSSEPLPSGFESQIESKNEYNWPYVTFTLSILFYSFCTRAILLCKNENSHAIFRVPSGQPWLWIEKKMLRFQGSSSERKSVVRVGRTICYKFLRANYVLIIAAHELYRSRAWEVTWLSFSVLWRTVRIISARENISSAFLTSDSYYRFKQKNNFWGFGQVIPLGLLLLPLANFVGTLFSPKHPVSNTSNNIIDSRWTILSNPFFHHTEMRSNHVQPISLLRSQIYANKWYPKIIWLLFFFSMCVVSYFLVVFSADNASLISSMENAGILAGGLLLWTFVITCLLWLNAVVCMDEHLQRWWHKLRISKWDIGKKTSFFFTAIYFCVLVGAAVSFLFSAW